MNLLGPMPVLVRELTTATRVGRFVWTRVAFTWGLTAMAVSTFLVKLSESGGTIGTTQVQSVFRDTFRLMVFMHVASCASVIGLAALSIAREKDRRTLDFLLATRLSNTEIIVAKLLSCLLLWFITIAAGIPFMVVMATFGGIDFRLIWLMYAAIFSMSIFLTSLGVFVSSAASDSRRAIAMTTAYFGIWLIGPFFPAWVFPRFGIRLPSWLLEINAWGLASSPMSLFPKILTGLGTPSLIDVVSRMCGLQLLLSIALLTIATLRLRSAYRANTGGDGRVLGRLLRGRTAKVRTRPPVADDPMVWRERYTRRYQGFLKFLDRIIWICLGGLMVAATAYFGWPALIEVVKNGYNSGLTTSERSDFNLFIRVFLSKPSLGFQQLDEARYDLNIFLRLSTLIVGFMTLTAGGFASETISVERSRETWLSLIATPLTAHEILWSKFKTVLWRLRPAILALAALWTFGMIAGALHPLGVIAASLQVAVWTGMMLACGLWSAARAKSAEPNQSVVALLALLIFTAALPYVVPARFATVFLGAASLPFQVWISLVSYRDVRAATHFAPYPPLAWMGIATGEGMFAVICNALLGIFLPAIVGILAWKSAVKHFDRNIGRPWRVDRPRAA